MLRFWHEALGTILMQRVGAGDKTNADHALPLCQWPLECSPYTAWHFTNKQVVHSIVPAVAQSFLPMHRVYTLHARNIQVSVIF